MMKLLKVAVIVKNSPAAFQREHRQMGQWSYPVEEFTWDFFFPGKQFALSTRRFQQMGYDLIFHEDGGAWGDYMHDAIPVIYNAIDSTLTDDHHYLPRLRQAQRANMVLVDHDQLERFSSCELVYRFSYCVNDHVFHPNGKSRANDIAYHCNGKDNGRAEVRDKLNQLAAAHDWTYRSGMLPLNDYAASFAASKIAVNVPRNNANRPHRVFDVMATGTCLLTAPIPSVSDEPRDECQHYVTFDGVDMLESALMWLLDTGEWERIGLDSYLLVRQHHTWAVRAKQLRQLLAEELGI